MSRLLVNDQPLIVLPSLAVKVGVNGALFLQQLHYWLEKSTHVKEGFKWVYNTNKQWLAQFPFWSLSTIQRIISKLEQDGLIVKGNYNRSKFNHTSWYRINYSRLQEMMIHNDEPIECYSMHINEPVMQTDSQLDSSQLTDMVNVNTANEPHQLTDVVKVTSSLTESTTENTKQRKREEMPACGPAAETNVNQEQYAYQLEQAFTAKRGGFYPSAKDLQGICEVASSGISLADALQSLHEAFDLYVPKYKGDCIRTFAYVKQHIFYKASVQKKRKKTAQNQAYSSKPKRQKLIRKEMVPDWLKDIQKPEAPEPTIFISDAHFEEEKRKLVESLRELERELKNGAAR
ncbi:hypothetical protein FZC66_06055 [Priestia megaterium]|nr:hypothetical protein FZC66_06055 [Priestia megaterium]